MLSASDQKIADLRSIAGRSRSRVERGCAQAKLFALEGRQAQAKHILTECLDAIAGEPKAGQKAQLLASAAIVIGEMDFASRLITDYIERNLTVHLSMDNSLPSSSAIAKWTIGPDNQFLFAFAPYFRPDCGEGNISRWLRTLPLVARLRSNEPQEGIVNLSLGDAGQLDGLAYCGNRPNIFLIPDPDFIGSAGYANTRDSFARNDVPWEKRWPIAFWRGSTSGRPAAAELGWRALPRVRLCEIGRLHPELIDAALTDIVQIADEKTRDEIESSGLMGRRRRISEIIQYRYQIDIDGNSNSWPGLFQKLLSGSTVLKVDSPRGFLQWYYDRLKPWVHFVPVAADLSDLVEKVQWVQANDAHANAIGQRGRELACSMNLDTELDRAVRTVKAAFRHSRNLPELSLSFGLGAAGNPHLRRGWAIEEQGSAWMVGRESSIEIPTPASRGEYTIELDVSPCITAPMALTICVNGDVGATQRIHSPQLVRHAISELQWSHDERLSLVLLNLTAQPMASAGRPLEERLTGIKLHAIRLTKCRPPASDSPASAGPKTRQTEVMRALHGDDIWKHFAPIGPRQDSIQGWNGLYQPFKRLLAEAPAKIFVDVGVWKGQSTVFVAEFMRESAMDGCVIAVDTFLGSVEHFVGKPVLFNRIHGRPDLYESFLDNVYYRGLTHLVVPFPQTSVSAAALLTRLGIKAGVVHLDASHEYEDTLRDAEVYWPLIETGGYLVGDDYHESWPGVVRAAQQFASAKGLQLSIHMPKWIVRKP